MLTDEEFFSGSAGRPGRGPVGLRAARAAQGLHGVAADVCDARLMGADAVLLIVAALSDEELAELREPGPGARPSTRWSRCTTRPSSTGPSTPGPSSSASTSATSTTFSVDPERAAAAGAGRSRPRWWPWPSRGSGTEPTSAALADAGYQAVLVGESLIRAPDRRAAVRALTGHRVGDRAGTGRCAR